MKIRNRHVTAAILCVWTAIFVVLWQNAFFVDEQGIKTTSSSIWGDWVVHLTFARVFGDWPVVDWFHTNPLFAIENLRYPLLANLISGALLRAGFSLESAMIVPSILFSVLLVAGLMLFYRIAGFNASAAGVGVCIFLFNGGMGFIAWAMNLATTPTHIPELGIIVQNFVTSEFLPQRSMLFGGFLFLLLVSGLYYSLQTPLSRKGVVFASLIGVGSAVLMLAHMHSYLTLVLICTIFFLIYWRAWRVWASLTVTAAITGSAVYFVYYASTDTSRFFQVEPFGLVTYSGTGLASFFVLNYGLFLPLILLAVFRTDIAKNPLFLAGVGLFTLGYVIRFQPWIWDNTKILTWSYLFLSVAVLRYLMALWERGIVFKGLVAAMTVMLCLSGAIEIVYLIRPAANTYTIFSTEDVHIANKFRKISTHRDLVLTNMPHNNWVHALSARPVFKGYHGWLWSYGLDAEKGDNLKRRMLEGDYALIRSYDISFVVVDEQNFAGSFNENLLSKLALVLESERYRVFAVPKQPDTRNGAIDPLSQTGNDQ